MDSLREMIPAKNMYPTMEYMAFCEILIKMLIYK